jgi:hypothetical protein
MVLIDVPGDCEEAVLIATRSAHIPTGKEEFS